MHLWHMWDCFHCVPDICVIGPGPAPSFGSTLSGTLFNAVLQVGELPSGAAGVQVGRQRAPPIASQC